MQSSHLPIDCEQWDSELFMHRGHAGLQRWGHLPVLACQTLCPASPATPPGTLSRSPRGGGWVPLISICLFPSCYDNPPERTSIPISPTLADPVTGGIRHRTPQLGPDVPAVVAGCLRGRAITRRHIALLKATACYRVADAVAGSLRSKLLTLKCLHAVLLLTLPIQTWAEVYVKPVIISFNSSLLPRASISFHPQCYHQCLSFFQNTYEIELLFQTLTKFLSKWGIFIRYCIPCFACLAVFRKWKQSLPLFLSVIKDQSTTETMSNSVFSPSICY